MPVVQAICLDDCIQVIELLAWARNTGYSAMNKEAWIPGCHDMNQSVENGSIPFEEKPLDFLCKVFLRSRSDSSEVSAQHSYARAEPRSAHRLLMS